MQQCCPNRCFVGPAPSAAALLYAHGGYDWQSVTGGSCSFYSRADQVGFNKMAGISWNIQKDILPTAVGNDRYEMQQQSPEKHSQRIATVTHMFYINRLNKVLFV